MSGPDAAVFLDFDGTITRRDATDAILEAFADPSWREIEQAWLSGRIGSRACLAAQMALVTATRDQVDRLLDEIGVDHGFVQLLNACAARAVPVHIVSDGFDYCVARILGRLNLSSAPTGSRIVSSSLRLDGGRWRASFNHPVETCPHGCATCKPAAMDRLNPTGAVTVFVGDGLSDRYAAVHADVVFAKDALAAHCDTLCIPYSRYDTLAAVADGIAGLIGEGLPRRPSLSGKGSPAV